MYLIARIGKAHGLRGEVTVQVHTDDPSGRFTVGNEFPTEPAEAGPLRVSSVRVHQSTYLLGFDGVTDRTGAEALRGIRLYVDPAAESAADADADGDGDADESGELEEDDLEDGWYPEDLLGFAVAEPGGAVIGEVTGLHLREAQDLLEVRLSHGGQALVPFVDQIVPEVDEEARVVVVDAPPGLFDLDG